MYHIAGKFEDMDAAGRVYTALEGALRQLQFYAHVARIQLKDGVYVSLIYDGDEKKIPANVMQTVHQLLGQGQICQLPPETVATIQRRRQNRRDQGVGTYVSHDPTRVTAQIPALRDRETGEELANFPELAEVVEEVQLSGPLPGSPVYPVTAGLKGVPREIRPQLAKLQAEVIHKHKEESKPFIIRFRVHIDEIVSKEEDGLDPLIAVYIEQLRTVTPYLFANSAMELFNAVWDADKTDFPIPNDEIWIEFLSAIEAPQGHVRAIMVTQVNPLPAIEQVEKRYPGLKGLSQLESFADRTLYRVHVVDDAMQIISTSSYDVKEGKWIYITSCPTKECITEQDAATGDDVIVQPCAGCVTRTHYWASWVRTLLLMIDREYAVSPEPKPWGTQTVTYEEEGTQRVGKSKKNQRTIKVTRKREVEYKIITFDVSLPEPKYVHTTEETSEEKRQNWLTTHSRDTWIYKRMHFAGIQRQYTGDHFKHLINRCNASGGSFVEEGREYTLSYREDGTAVVTSAVVEFDKYVPMLRDKTPVIKKAVASHPQKQEE